MRLLVSTIVSVIAYGVTYYVFKEGRGSSAVAMTLAWLWVHVVFLEADVDQLKSDSVSR